MVHGVGQCSKAARATCRRAGRTLTLLAMALILSGPSAFALPRKNRVSTGAAAQGGKPARTSPDRRRGAAERAQAEGARLKAQKSQKGLLGAIEKYAEAHRLWQAIGDQVGAAVSLQEIGGAYKELGDAAKALSYYEEAVSIYRKAGDGGWDAFVANDMNATYATLGGKRNALAYLTNGLPLLQSKDAILWRAMMITAIGVTYKDLGESQKALESFNTALEIRKGKGDRYGEAINLHYIAKVYDGLGDKEKAISNYENALTIFRDLRSGATGHIHPYIMSQGYLLGDREQSLKALNLALLFLQRAGAKSLQALVYDGISEVYFELGELQKAIDNSLKAVELYHSSADHRGEVSALSQVSKIYLSLEEDQKALEVLNRGLQVARESGQRREEAYALNAVAMLYNEIGDHKKAIEYAQQGAALAQSLGEHRDEATGYQVLGTAHRKLGDKRKAIEYYNRAIEIERLTKDSFLEASALNLIGSVYGDLGDNQKALEYYNRALVLKRQALDRQDEAYTLTNIGKIYNDLGDNQKALEFYNQALAITRAIGDRGEEAFALYRIARIERDRGELSEARARIEGALEIVESLRAKIASQELRTSYFATVQKYYQFYVDLLMQQHQRRASEGFDAAALQASERSRARSLLELLVEARTDIRQGVDPALIERERALRQLLNAKAERQIKLLSGKHTEIQAATIKQEIESLTTQYQQLQAQIRETSPRYAALTQPRPFKLSEIQEQALDTETLLLEYSLGEERSYLWAVTRSDISSYVLPKRAEVEAAARRVYNLLTARQPVRGETIKQYQARVAKASEEYPARAAELSQMLLGPVATQLGSKRLLVVSEGALQYIPFAALPVPQGTAPNQKNSNPDAETPLIVDREVLSLPSASALMVLRAETGGRKPAPRAIAVLADPVFDEDDPRVKPTGPGRKRGAATDSPAVKPAQTVREGGVIETGGSLSRLPSSREEAEAILALTPTDQGMKALDFNANRALATSGELGKYRVVHFATHGLLNSEHPELSGIVLSLVNEQGQPQDGFLGLHDIYNLYLPSELVVLSACRTGLGKEVKGEGLIGLTRGFMYAGAARVVASLWKVDDDATAEFMKRFYQEMLGKGMRPAAALRAAQVEMWKQKQWKPPYYWAAFVLQGEWK